MSLKTRFKNLGNILAQDETQTRVFVLESPVLTTGMYERMLLAVGAGATIHIDCTFIAPLRARSRARPCVRRWTASRARRSRRPLTARP